MNGRDPVATLLATVDGPAAPRPEFADALLTQLTRELGGRDTQTTPVPPRRRRRRFGRPTSPRLRLALIVLSLLLLAAALAVAAHFGTRWLSAERRGVQYSAEYDLTVVMRTPREHMVWGYWRLGTGGRDVYALRQPREWVPLPPHNKEWDLMRVPAAASASRPVRPERLLVSAELADPELWGPGVDLEGAVVGPHLPPTPGTSPLGTLAVADNGDLFLIAGAWEQAVAEDPAAQPIATSLIVRHGDGRMERVLSIDDLGLGVPAGDVDLHVTASAPGRLWLMAWALRSGRWPRTGPPHGPYSFFEVRDPDGDGDWADRTVRRLVVPDSLPLYDRGAKGRQETFLTQIEAEPPMEGQPPSFLLASLGYAMRFRVHRIADRNGDGDALDDDEVRRVVRARVPGNLETAGHVPIAARVVDGRREIVAAGLTRRTRLSIVSSDGRVTDVARAFQHLSPPGVLAGPDGRIYAPTQESQGERGTVWRLYKLEPGRRERATASATPAAPPGAAGVADGHRGVPRIAFTVKSTDFSRGRIVTVRADGRGQPRRLLPGRYNDGFCQSADRSRIAYFSDEEAPGERFLYVVGSDGGGRRKVTERDVSFWCGFSSRWLLLLARSGQAQTLQRHDLRSGRRTRLAGGVDRLALSPDGTSVLFVGGLRFAGRSAPRGRETLEVLDLGTGNRRRLAGPLEQGSFGTRREGTLVWSPDGSRVAYSIGPRTYLSDAGKASATPQPYTVRVQAADGAPPRTVLTVRGGAPALTFSPDGDELLACFNERPDPENAEEVGCSGSGPPDDAKPAARLVFVDLVSGRTRAVARGPLHFAGWAPRGGTLAYATDDAVFLVDGGTRAPARRLARVPAEGWPVGAWLGFSPDGRYIGLGNFSKYLAVLDVRTGARRVLARERGGKLFLYRKWWRR